MKRISAIILCVLLCASCERHGGNDKDLGNDDNITGAVNSEGFLISYIYPCELDIQRGDADSLKVLIRGDSATDEEKHILMEKYGDTTFNSTLIEPTGLLPSNLPESKSQATRTSMPDIRQEHPLLT